MSDEEQVEDEFAKLMGEKGPTGQKKIPAIAKEAVSGGPKEKLIKEDIKKVPDPRRPSDLLQKSKETESILKEVRNTNNKAIFARTAVRRGYIALEAGKIDKARKFFNNYLNKHRTGDFSEALIELELAQILTKTSKFFEIRNRINKIERTFNELGIIEFFAQL